MQETRRKWKIAISKKEGARIKKQKARSKKQVANIK